MLGIHCTYFWFLMTTINIILHVSVYETYFFFLIIVYLHNIFHIVYLPLLCCPREFIGRMKSLFAAFINTNITTTCLFFIFQCDQSLLLVLIIIFTERFFVYLLPWFTQSLRWWFPILFHPKKWLPIELFCWCVKTIIRFFGPCPIELLLCVAEHNSWF